MQNIQISILNIHQIYLGDWFYMSVYKQYVEESSDHIVKEYQYNYKH